MGKIGVVNYSTFCEALIKHPGCALCTLTYIATDGFTEHETCSNGNEGNGVVYMHYSAESSSFVRVSCEGCSRNPNGFSKEVVI